MADEPFARWLVAYCEGRGWRSGRQAAKFLRDAEGREFNPAVVGTWVRGAQLPDDENQQRLAEATGERVERIAELVRQTKADRRGRAPEPHRPHDRDTASAVPDTLIPGGASGGVGTEAALLAEVALPLLTGDMTGEERAYLEAFVRRVNQRRAATGGGQGEPGRGSTEGAAD